MAEREVFVRWRFGGDDPATEVGKAKDALKSVGDAGREAGKETAIAFAPVDEKLEEVDRAGEALLRTMEKLKRSEMGGNLRQAGALAAVAAVQLEQLRTASERAGISGSEAGKRIADGMAKTEAAIKSATVQAAKLRDAAGDLKSQADQTAKGAEAMAGSFSSVDGLLGRMADSSSPATQSLAKLGFQLSAVAAAAMAGYEAGNKLKEVFPQLTKLDVSGWLAKLITGTNAAAIKLEDYNVKARSAVGETNQIRMAVEAAAEALRAQVPAFSQFAKSQDDAATSTKLFGEFLAASVKSGKTAEEVAKGNAVAIAAWAASIRAADGDLGRLNAQQLAAVRVAEAEVAATQKLQKVTDAYYKSAVEAAEKKRAAIEAAAKKAIEAADAEAAALEKEIRAAKQRNASREEILALEAKYEAAVMRSVAASREQEEETKKVTQGIEELTAAKAEMTARDEEGARASAASAQATSANTEEQLKANQAVNEHAEGLRRLAEIQREQNEVSREAAERLKLLKEQQDAANRAANEGKGALDDLALAAENLFRTLGS